MSSKLIGTGISFRTTKKGEKVWDIDTSHKCKKLRKRGFKSLKAAKLWRHEQIVKIDGFKFVEKVYRWEDLEREFRDRQMSERRQSTNKRYDEDIRIRLEPEFRFMKLEDISTSLIESLKTKWVKSGNWKPKTINNCLTTLSTMFSKGTKWGMVGNNPVTLVDRLKVDNIQSGDWWEYESDVQKYILGVMNLPRHVGLTRLGFNASEPFQAALILPIELGLRRGEVCGLDRRDVNLIDCTVTVRQSYRDGLLGPLKTKNASRTLYFNRDSVVFDLLLKCLKTQSDCPALFVNSLGNRLDGDELSEVFRHWQIKLQLPRITYHGLRRTFGSWFMKRGGNLWDLFQIMGHESYDVTVKRYARFGKNSTIAPLWVQGSGKMANPHSTHNFVAE